ncbi:MAG: iron-containing alcohol dehydrogenase [Desulfobacterales bacterium]|nr:iron-containing alcohol dehydrogenase [Desulfobacterales bacterium]
MSVPDHYEFLCPSKILSGLAALKNLPVELQALNSTRPLILADGQALASGRLKRVIGAFRDSAMTIGVYEGVTESSDRHTVAQLVELFHDKGHDAVVAVGEGAVTEVAKGLRMAAVHPDGSMARAVGENGATIPLKPLVQVMTGPGTGKEASRMMTLSGVVLADHALMPELVVIDPSVVRLADSRTAAEAALGILARGAEAACGVDGNPMIDIYAHAAIALVAENIQQVLAKPGDKKGKLSLTNASVMAAVAFSNAPAGPAHRLAAASAAAINLLPGILMGLILPYSLAWLARSNHEAVARLLLPLGGFDRYADTSPKRRAEAAVEKIFEILRRMEPVGIMGPLGRNGMTEGDIEGIAATAANMAPVMDAASMATILANAFAGGPVSIAGEAA